ncbi:MAG: hypothetical protein H6554_11755 [Chitinophagales bacterium]|nr:hypothetical protein [Chitinophagales bacterium]
MIFKNIKIWIVGSFVFLAIIIFMLFVPSLKETEINCIWSDRMKISEFEGIVDKKYKDSMNHNKPTILIRKKGEVREVHFLNDKSSFYSSVLVGDSINKKKNTLNVSVYAKTKKEIYKLNYGCDE